MNVLLAFAPFLTFAVLENRLGVHPALLAATLVAGALVARGALMQHRSLKILEVGSLALFGALAFASRFPQFDPSILVVRLWVDGGLLAIVAGSILVGRPFTTQYALEGVSPEVAATSRFKSINLTLSCAWAAAFAVIVAADAGMLYAHWFTPVMGAVVILGAIAGAAWLTSWLPKQEARNPVTA